MCEVLAPVSGTYVPIENVADPGFAEKMMGDGFPWRPRPMWSWRLSLAR